MLCTYLDCSHAGMMNMMFLRLHRQFDLNTKVLRYHIGTVETVQFVRGSSSFRKDVLFVFMNHSRMISEKDEVSSF